MYNKVELCGVNTAQLPVLSESEKRIMELRYLRGKTQMEVAQEIGISQAQVSRLEKGALNQFRAGH